jgi:hypothetical protein
MDTTQVVVTVSLAITGWVAGHLFALRQSRETERRKSRVDFLMKTYKRITELRVFASGLDGESVARFLCDIGSDVELQGTEIQTELAAQAKAEILENGSLATLDALAQNLLDDLRGNLKLVRIQRQASIFGYTPKDIGK